MIRFLLIFAMLFGGPLTYANEELSRSMEVIGEQFTLLGRGVQLSEFTQAQYEAVEILQKEIAVSALIFPDLATTDALKLQYNQWMAQLMQMALRMEEQIEEVLDQNPQDLTDLTQTLVAMNELRKEAHEVFKEEN